MYLIDDWKLVRPRTSSGTEALCINGYVRDNPRFANGQLITTSIVRRHRLESGTVVIVTRKGSEYRLGKPSPSEPFAMQRLMRYLEAIPATSRRTRDPEVETRPPNASDVDYDLVFLGDE